MATAPPASKEEWLRFNVFLIGMDMGTGWSYFPSVGEFAITFGFIAFGVFLYKIAVNYLPILEEH